MSDGGTQISLRESLAPARAGGANQGEVSSGGKNCGALDGEITGSLALLQGFPVRFLSHPFTLSLICVPCNVIGVTWHARWSVPFHLLHRSIWFRSLKSVWKRQAQILNMAGLRPPSVTFKQRCAHARWFQRNLSTPQPPRSGDLKGAGEK